MRVNYGIDSTDWSSGHDDRDKCVEALGTWFENLSFKTQLAIHYAQQNAAKLIDQFDGNDFCPWLSMVWKAETRIMKKYASWTPGTGFNLFLYTRGIELEGEA